MVKDPNFRKQPIRPTPDPETPGEEQGPELSSSNLVEVQARLVATEKQLEDMVLLLKQTQAEFENYQKRAARERESERKYAYSPIVRDLLPALDNLHRALESARQAHDEGPLAQGVAATENQILQILARHGVTPIDALHQPFDPNRHEAVMQAPSADYPPGTVVQVLQAGYQMHDRVLRPTTVCVSTAAS